MEKTKKSFFESKIFAVAVILFGTFGLLILAHHIFSYDAILRPHLAELLEKKVITNDINGYAFLRMFTNQSNIFVDVFLILFGVGLLGSKKLYDLTHKDEIRGGVTLYILITGIIYCCVLLPFQQATFADVATDASDPIRFSNVFNIWAHMVVPIAFFAFWFVVLSKKKIPVVKTARYYLIYPLAYFAVSVVLGKIDGFYPYPFLSSVQLWNMLFGAQPIEAATPKAVLLLIAVILVLCGIFFGFGCLLIAIHNSLVGQKIKEKVTV